MKIPPQITFRHLDPSPGLEALIGTSVATLHKYYNRIMGCRVLVEVPHRHHEHGNRYHVRIDVTVPGGEIVVTHEPTLYTSLQDVEGEKVTKETDIESVHRHVEVAVNEAFDIARRRLQDYARRRRGAVKVHQVPPRGTVVRLGSEEGWIETPDGREIYFHAHAVLGDGFRKLQIGRDVTFVEEQGDKGPQASTIRLLRKPRTLKAKAGMR